MKVNDIGMQQTAYDYIGTRCYKKEPGKSEHVRCCSHGGEHGLQQCFSVLYTPSASSAVLSQFFLANHTLNSFG